MNYKYLSSKLTFFFKFVLPITFLLFLLFFIIGALTFFPEEHSSLYIAFVSFLTICLLLLAPHFFLKKIYYNETYIYVDNYKKVTNLKFEQYNGINSYLIYFYKLSYLDDKNKSKSIIFLPHISEKVYALMGTPKSIKEFKDKIQKKEHITKQK